MIKKLDEARSEIQSVEDINERMFLIMALKTALIDVKAGSGSKDVDFDYLIFINVMKELYKKKKILINVLNGQSEKHRWWPEDE